MPTYKTSEIAEIIGVHPNTVRLYEQLKLIPKAERKGNGYRVFTDFHICQFRLARTAFQIEVLQAGLRKKIISAVISSAAGDFDGAIKQTQEYIAGLEHEIGNAEEAIHITEDVLIDNDEVANVSMKRKEAALYLGVSADSLRNWEMNGLLTVKRMENGYRVYTDDDIKRLKIIRSLRCANYSLEAILRMLLQISKNPDADVKTLLDTPSEDTDIISVCDKLITSLQAAQNNAQDILKTLHTMKEKY